ncbi:unnamed protein product [Amoebophrya sp. A120]|nr:unnamed protein product [Amoebophrya sp. A120]|eukprot:GSA120T00017342001.1
MKRFGSPAIFLWLVSCTSPLSAFQLAKNGEGAQSEDIYAATPTLDATEQEAIVGSQALDLSGIANAYLTSNGDAPYDGNRKTLLQATSMTNVAVIVSTVSVKTLGMSLSRSCKCTAIFCILRIQHRASSISASRSR